MTQENTSERVEFKNWLRLSEIFKIYQTSYTEVIREIAFKNLQVTIVDGEVWFYRGNLEIVFKGKQKIKKSAHQIYCEAKKQNLTDKEFKAKLIKEGIIIKK